MLSFLLILFLLWLFLKLGIGIIKIIGFLFIIVITAAFFTYLLFPLLVIFVIGGLLWNAIR